MLIAAPAAAWEQSDEPLESQCSFTNNSSGLFIHDPTDASVFNVVIPARLTIESYGISSIVVKNNGKIRCTDHACGQNNIVGGVHADIDNRYNRGATASTIEFSNADSDEPDFSHFRYMRINNIVDRSNEISVNTLSLGGYFMIPHAPRVRALVPNAHYTVEHTVTCIQ